MKLNKENLDIYYIKSNAINNSHIRIFRFNPSMKENFNFSSFREIIFLSFYAAMAVDICKFYIIRINLGKENEDIKLYSIVSKERKKSFQLTEEKLEELKKSGATIEGIAEMMVTASLIQDVDCVGNNFSNFRLEEIGANRYKIVKFDAGGALLGFEAGELRFKEVYKLTFNEETKIDDKLESLKSGDNLLKIFSDKIVMQQETFLKYAKLFFDLATEEDKIKALNRLQTLDINEISKLIMDKFTSSKIDIETTLFNNLIEEIIKSKKSILSFFEKYINKSYQNVPICELDKTMGLKHYQDKKLEDGTNKTPLNKLILKKSFYKDISIWVEQSRLLSNTKIALEYPSKILQKIVKECKTHPCSKSNVNIDPNIPFQ